MIKQSEKKNVILSIDAETDGLWGKPFAIAAICYNEDGQEISSFCARSNEPVQNEWVKENVLPHITDIVSVGGYENLLSEFAKYYNCTIKKYNVTALFYGGHVVEAFLFRELVDRKLIGYFDAPYTPIDVSTILTVNNEDASSVEAYLHKKHIQTPSGHVDTPLYDAKIAYLAYRDLTMPHSRYTPFPLLAIERKR